MRYMPISYPYFDNAFWFYRYNCFSQELWNNAFANLGTGQEEEQMPLGTEWSWSKNIVFWTTLPDMQNCRLQTKLFCRTFVKVGKVDVQLAVKPESVLTSCGANSNRSTVVLRRSLVYQLSRCFYSVIGIIELHRKFLQLSQFVKPSSAIVVGTYWYYRLR